MMNTKKRWLAALLSVVMVVAMLPSMAFAATQPEPITGLAYDAKTNVLTFNKVAKEDGTGYIGDYDFELQSRKKISQNDQDWTKIDAASFDAEQDVADDASKAYTKLNYDASNYDSELSYRFVVKAKFGGKDYFAALAHTPEAATKQALVGDVTLKKHEGGLRTEVVIASDDEKAATDLKVVLYKTATKTGTLAMLPADAVKVSEKAVKTIAGTNVIDFAASDFTYEDPAKVLNAKNFYFVSVVGSKAGLKDSDAKYSARQERKEAEGKTAAPTEVKITDDYGTVVVKSVANVELTVQLYDATNPTKAVGEAVTKEATATSTTFDMSEFITKKGLYFAKVTAKAAGLEVSDVVASESRDLVAKDKVQDITATMDENGKVTVNLGKDGATQATYVKYVVLYKGNAVTKESDKVLKATLDSKGITMTDWKALQRVVGTPEPTLKNLSDFALKIVGGKDTYRDSEAFIVSYGGELSTPTNAAWDGSKNNPTAKWNAVAGAEEYVVTFVKDGTDVKTVTVKGTSVNLLDAMGTDEIANGTYTFTVQAKAGYKLSVPAVSYGKTFVVTGRTAEPKNVKWDGDKATWDAVYGADYYVVRKLVNGKQVGPDCKTTANFYQFKGMKNPGAYEFTVRAFVDTDKVLGSKEVKSESMKLIEKATVGTPFITNASKTKTTVKLRWTAADNAKLYRIYYKTKSMDSYKIIVKEVRGDATAKTVKGLKKGTKYQFKVKAVNDGVGAYSNVKVVTTTK